MEKSQTEITEEMIDRGVEAFVLSGSLCKSGGGRRIMMEEILCAALGIPVDKTREIKTPEHWLTLDPQFETISYPEYLQSLRKVPLLQSQGCQSL